MAKSVNILLVGIGGQGVNSLYHVLQESILKAGLFSKGAIFKGGAQKRGAIYAMIRIFEKEIEQDSFSPIIPKGKLDVLLALESNEALRYASYYHTQTKMIINDFVFPFYAERFKETSSVSSPIELIKSNFRDTTIVNFNTQSEQLFGHVGMVNIIIGLELLRTGLLKIEENTFLDLFQQKVKLTYEDMLKLMQIENS